MWRILLIAMMVAGCAQLPPTPQEIQAKQFQSVKDKAVIYVVRGNPDITNLAATLVMDSAGSVTTYPGTFARWEVPPGTHRITGMAADTGAITLQVDAGRIYYVRQSVVGWRSPSSFLQMLSESDGRDYAMRGTLIP